MTMLKTIPATLTPDLLWTIAAMGHGDTLAIVDANYPAHSHHTKVITLAGVPLVKAIRDLLRFLPVDDFIDAPVVRMVPDGKPDFVADVHADIQAILDEAEGRQVEVRAVERSAFYPEASKVFAVVATTDDRPFGCFIITKGVIRTSRDA